MRLARLARRRAPARELHDRRAQRFAWRLEALGSGFVALLALFVSAYTVYINRQQMRAQTWPRLVERVDGSDKDGRVSVFIRNNGVAPAEIRAARVSIGGRDVRTWREYLTRIAAMRGPDAKGGLSLGNASPLVGEVIAPGQEITLFTPRDIGTLAQLEAVSDRTELDLCYCSMLDECWEYQDEGVKPKVTRVVPRCDPYAVPFVGFDEQDRANETAYVARLASDAEKEADAGGD
jgi:hypothetical protein